MVPVGRAGWGDRALSFVLLAGLTLMSGTPYNISPTGLFVHVDSWAPSHGGWVPLRES